MIKNYFKIAWRNIERNKFYSLIHILGLGIGIACCLFIYFYVQFHLSYDNYHKNKNHLYRVVYDLHLEKTEHDSGSSYAIYKELTTHFPAVEQGALAMTGQELTLNINGDPFSTNKKASFTSSEWFKLFDYHWLQGNPSALDQPNTVALMASTARKFFGKEDVLDQTIYVDSKYPLKVVGIIDDNLSNTSLKSDLYISLASVKTVIPGILDGFFTDWGYTNSTNQLYIRVSETAQVTTIEQMLAQKTIALYGEETGKLFTFHLQPLNDVHFNPDFGGSIQKSLLSVLTIIGLGILFIATINYVNLSLVQYAKKSAEIGTRKVLGGSRLQLFFQFMTESVCLVGLGILLALSLFYLLLPTANNLLFIKEPIAYPSLIAISYFSFCIWLSISLLSGIYPAYMAGRLSVVHALKNAISFHGANSKRAMVFIQNTLSQCLIIGTIVMVAQVHFLRSTNLGFSSKSVLLVDLPKNAKEKENAINTFLRDKAAVLDYTFCLNAPGTHDARGGTLLFDERPEWETWAARSTYADSSYLSTMGIRLLAGRNIRENKVLPEYIVNAKMVKQLGYRNPQDVIGKSLLGGGMHDEKTGVIVGVVADYNTKSLREAIEPTVIGYYKPLFQTLAIKVDVNNWKVFAKQLEEEWSALFPKELLRYRFLDEQIGQLYDKETVQQKLIWTAATLAIFISSLGLLGLVSLNVLQRTKEIGIRKVLGATVTGIVALLSKDFIRLVVIALFVASPIAFWAMNKWLENFAYHIDLQWWMFALAGITALIIALLTVSWQAIKAALANPVDSLRNE